MKSQRMEGRRVFLLAVDGGLAGLNNSSGRHGELTSLSGITQHGNRPSGCTLHFVAKIS